MVIAAVANGVMIIVFGLILLRIGGRRSISQMTIAQAVIMISIGTLLIGPLQTKNVWITMAIALGFIGTLIVVEYIQLWSEKMETWIIGKSVMLIENGELNKKTLDTMRMTVDQLEMRLRQKQVENIDDVKWAALEPSGQLSFALKEAAKPATKADLQRLIELLQPQAKTPFITKSPLFEEIVRDGHSPPPPERLQ